MAMELRIRLKIKSALREAATLYFSAVCVTDFRGFCYRAVFNSHDFLTAL